MIITALNESKNDTRVAITPNSVKHYIKLGVEVFCETQAGMAAGFTDEEYTTSGAHICKDKSELLQKTDVLLCVNAPSVNVLKQLNPNALLITHLTNEDNHAIIEQSLKQQISLFSMNLIPRISRAQGMDSLSSQANLAGYRAVLEGVSHFKRAIPMMMTAAGMIQPAKILILGAGVAGLQAIATAKRLGAVVYAFDVRSAAKEQVESLGAEFIEVNEEANDTHETSSGYAREMSESYKKLQAELIDTYARLADIVVSTALIPGKKAPLLITENTVSAMKKGAVIVDLATSNGGNCAVSVENKMIDHSGVTVIGFSNMAGFVPATASELYSQNLLNLMKLLVVDLKIVFNPEDEIIKQALLCHAGNTKPFQTVKETSV